MAEGRVHRQGGPRRPLQASCSRGVLSSQVSLSPATHQVLPHPSQPPRPLSPPGPLSPPCPLCPLCPLCPIRPAALLSKLTCHGHSLELVTWVMATVRPTGRGCPLFLPMPGCSPEGAGREQLAEKDAGQEEEDGGGWEGDLFREAPWRIRRACGRPRGGLREGWGDTRSFRGLEYPTYPPLGWGSVGLGKPGVRRPEF